MVADLTTPCVCRHSFTAHKIGKAKGCSFCTCEAFRDPADAPPPPPQPLSDRALKALEILSRNPSFKHVASEHLAEIARGGQRRLFLAGAHLMEQGEASDSLHILVKGTVRVERIMAGREPLLLADLSAGDIVGEMGVLNGDPRSATVTAEEDIETLELTAPQLKKIFQEDPDILLAIMRVVNERIRTTDDLVETSIKVALAQLTS